MRIEVNIRSLIAKLEYTIFRGVNDHALWIYLTSTIQLLCFTSVDDAVDIMHNDKTRYVSRRLSCRDRARVKILSSKTRNSVCTSLRNEKSTH